MAEIFSKIDENPYDALELSVSMGHETPEITLSSYTHAQIIYILLHLNLEKGIQ